MTPWHISSGAFIHIEPKDMEKSVRLVSCAPLMLELLREMAQGPDDEASTEMVSKRVVALLMHLEDVQL
jgi:hypothetical protein